MYVKLLWHVYIWTPNAMHNTLHVAKSSMIYFDFFLYYYYIKTQGHKKQTYIFRKWHTKWKVKQTKTLLLKKYFSLSSKINLLPSKIAVFKTFRRPLLNSPKIIVWGHINNTREFKANHFSKLIQNIATYGQNQISCNITTYLQFQFYRNDSFDPLVTPKCKAFFLWAKFYIDFQFGNIVIKYL